MSDRLFPFGGLTAGLSRQLETELIRLMSERAWTLDVEQPQGLMIGSFQRPVGSDFTVAAAFVRSSITVPDRPPLVVSALLGLRYEPLRRLWPRIKEDPPWAEISYDAGFCGGPLTPSEQRVFQMADVPRAALGLVTLVSTRAEAFAQDYGNVDVLLNANTVDPDGDELEGYVVPALLASAGRYAEAKASLGAYLADSDRDVDPQQYEAFTKALLTWIENPIPS
jgi:hypothetical protein